MHLVWTQHWHLPLYFQHTSLCLLWKFLSDFIWGCFILLLMHITLNKTFLESSVHHIFAHKLPARQKMLSGSYCSNISRINCAKNRNAKNRLLLVIGNNSCDVIFFLSFIGSTLVLDFLFFIFFKSSLLNSKQQSTSLSYGLELMSLRKGSYHLITSESQLPHLPPPSTLICFFILTAATTNTTSIMLWLALTISLTSSLLK